jgi:two-component sensor histidine kinase
MDDVERIYFWRWLNGCPGIALVGLGEADSQAGPNGQIILLTGLGVLLVGFLVALTVLLVREISRRTKQALALAERTAELAAARVDLAERKRYEEHINLLLREVNHRSKNLLAVVQAIARRTVAASPESFIERFEERIRALAASQDLLVESEWRGVTIYELVRSQLRPFKDLIDKRFALSGPNLLISASAAQTIGMAIHELATNAGKYGALSNHSGRVEVRWRLEPKDRSEETFVIIWRERGGPAVSAPSRTGFGSTVLLRIAEESLTAEVELNYSPTGLVWQLRCLATKVLQTAAMLNSAETGSTVSQSP